MSQLYGLLKMLVVDRVLVWILRQVKRSTSSERKQACVLLLLMVLYLNVYNQVVVKTEGSLYDLLELNHEATHEQIRTRGRRLLASLHPDRVKDSQERYIEVEGALAVLGNKSGKWLYDRFRVSKESFVGGR